MNTVTLMRHPNFAAAEKSGLLIAAARLAHRFRRHLKARSDRQLLESMPDYILADIGISRGGIKRAVTYGRMHDGRR